MSVNSRVDRVCASGHRKESIFSINRCPYIKTVNFRNCPLCKGVRIKRVFRLAEIKILCLSSYYIY